MSGLEGKKVLFIGVGFYDYDQLIIKALNKKGCDVSYFKSVPKRRLIDRLLSKFILGFEKRLQDNYLESLKSQILALRSVDYVFVIKGERLNSGFLGYLKDNFCKAKFILYHWDAINRVDNHFEICGLFDRVITFDRYDSVKYDYDFLPLFYSEDYESPMTTIKYDIYFSGSYHSDRCEVLNLIKENAEKSGGSVFIFLRMNFRQYIKNFIKKFLSNEKYCSQDFIFTKGMSARENALNMAMSHSVIDIHHPDQSGLTMRTIETLSMRKKLITTNPDIVNYAFYHPKNCIIFDRENPDISLEVVREPFYISTETDMKKYSLSSWISQVFMVKTKNTLGKN